VYLAYERLHIQKIKQAGDYGDKQTEPDSEIKGVEGGEHIIAEEKTVAEIRLQIDKRKNKQEIKDKGNHINGGQPHCADQDKKIKEYTVDRKGYQGPDETG
jgi:hypothetical protein